MKFSAFLFFIAALSASAQATIIEHCSSSDSLNIQCGFSQVEDIAAIEGGKQFIFSEMSGEDKSEGKLGLYTPLTKSYSYLFDSEKSSVIIGDSWGEKSCQWPKKISPHGIHLSSRTLTNGNTTTQLLVVNHGESEQILWFELQQDNESLYSLAPKGCVTFPPLAKLNDVVALNDGDFAATQMYQANQKMVSQFKALLGYETGFVYHWSSQTGLTALDESDGVLPNGIETNATRDRLFVNMYFGDAVKIYSLKRHKFIDSFDVEQPDNSSWTKSGELLIASHRTSFFEVLDCIGIEKGSCGGAFDIIALNPNTGISRTVYSNQGGEAFGPASIAVEVINKEGTMLLMGSFSGDRIATTKQALKSQQP